MMIDMSTRVRQTSLPRMLVSIQQPFGEIHERFEGLVNSYFWNSINQPDFHFHVACTPTEFYSLLVGRHT